MSKPDQIFHLRPHEAKLGFDPVPVLQVVWDIMVYDAPDPVWNDRATICGPDAPPLP